VGADPASRTDARNVEQVIWPQRRGTDARPATAQTVYPTSALFPGGRQSNPAPKAASFGLVLKHAQTALPAALLGLVVHATTCPDGAIYGEADFTSNMLGRGLIQKLRNSLSSEIKIFPGTTHLLHLLHQQIKILLPIGEI
jgi:pimeloyl-ACP methyl ester carboxylesterase